MPTSPQHLIILLHGYAESGERITRKLGPVIHSLRDTTILAPNAPFALEGKPNAFSWYLYDRKTGEYIEDMTRAVAFLESEVQRLGLQDAPKTIIGFSQGGYLAPIAAQHLTHVERVIGIGAEYLHEEVASSPVFPVDAIHGEQDAIIPWTDARQSHEALLARGFSGRFYSVADSGHPIDDRIREALRGVLAAGILENSS